MGLGTLLLVATAATAGAAAGGAFSSPSKPRMPPLPTVASIMPPQTKSDVQKSRAYLAAWKAKQTRSRKASQIMQPGYLMPAQTGKPTLSDVLG